MEELALTVVMAVQVVCDLERQEGTHAHCQGSQHFVTNVEVVVGVATALSRNDAVVRIKSQQAAKQLCEGFHWSSRCSCIDIKIIRPEGQWNQIPR